MRHVRSAVLAVVIGLSGCTTSRPLPSQAEASTLIDYLQALRRETSTLLDTVVTQTTAPTIDASDYRAWGDHWCPRHTEVHSTDDVVKKVAAYCEQRRGRFDEPYCLSVNIPDLVVFYAKFQRGIDLCQGVAATVSVQIVEPKLGRGESAGYISRLHELGYRSSTDIALADAVQRKELVDDQARAKREMPLLTTRGTRICSKQNGSTYIGFVEDTSGPKIRISVQEAYVGVATNGTFGTRNPNYQPQVLWDFPEHWYVCE